MPAFPVQLNFPSKKQPIKKTMQQWAYCYLLSILGYSQMLLDSHQSLRKAPILSIASIVFLSEQLQLRRQQKEVGTFGAEPQQINQYTQHSLMLLYKNMCHIYLQELKSIIMISILFAWESLIFSNYLLILV